MERGTMLPCHATWSFIYLRAAVSPFWMTLL